MRKNSPSTNREVLAQTKEQSSRVRRIVSGALYVLLTGAGIFAALQIREFWVARQATSPNQKTIADLSFSPTSRPASLEPQSGKGWLSAELAEAHLQPLEGDPLGIAPPAPSIASQGFSRTLQGELQQQRTYDFSGELLQAQDHYTKVLAQRGFALQRQRSDPDGTYVLVFAKAREVVTVALRNSPGEVKIVRIAVTVICPT